LFIFKRFPDSSFPLRESPTIDLENHFRPHKTPIGVWKTILRFSAPLFLASTACHWSWTDARLFIRTDPLTGPTWFTDGEGGGSDLGKKYPEIGGENRGTRYSSAGIVH